MSETKFTKGPWKATYDSQLQALIEIYNTEDRVMVAVLPDRGTIEAMPEIEANADLIAAAPDMYEALNAAEKELQRTCEQCKAMGHAWFCDDSCTLSVIQQIDRALKKARGDEHG